MPNKRRKKVKPEPTLARDCPDFEAEGYVPEEFKEDACEVFDDPYKFEVYQGIKHMLTGKEREGVETLNPNSTSLHSLRSL